VEITASYPAGVIGDTPANLEAAAAGEHLEWSKLYKDAEKDAREEGLEEIADLFKEIAEVEEEHEKRYRKLLSNVKGGTVFKKDTVVKWHCRNCGYVHEGKEAPGELLNMKVLAIIGSPRKGGNTDTLLDKALEGANANGAETEKIVLNDLKFSPCQETEYDNVNDEGLSVIDDDIQLVFRKLAGSDALILASPIFFGSLSAQTKMMIDRFQCVWLAKNMLHKDVFPKKQKGAFISVEASDREDFFENARSIVRHFFATTNVHYEEELFCPGMEKKGDALKRPDLLEKAFELGKRIAS
jgi:multimeric flavodoxin WrbA